MSIIILLYAATTCHAWSLAPSCKDYETLLRQVVPDVLKIVEYASHRAVDRDHPFLGTLNQDLLGFSDANDAVLLRKAAGKTFFFSKKFKLN